MARWLVEVALAVIGVVMTVFFYYDKKKTKKLDEDFLDVWEHVESMQREKERLDRHLTAVSKEVELMRLYTERQFTAIDCSQKELRDVSMKQGEEIKDLIRDLTVKIDSYFQELNKLNLRVEKHISKTGTNGDA